MQPLRPNPENLDHAVGPLDKKSVGQILQRADVVWSRIKLEPGEVLLVKLSAHLRPVADDVVSMIDTAFGRDGDRVVVFFEDEVEFTKYLPPTV